MNRERYATYIGRCSRLYIQHMLMLMVELLIANRFGSRLPL